MGITPTAILGHPVAIASSPAGIAVARPRDRRRMPIADFHQLTEAGPARPRNEDAIGHWACEDGVVFAAANGFVVDGTAEPEAGQVASTLALAVFGRELGTFPRAWTLRSRLQRAVQAANVALYQKALAVPELRAMRTTMTATALAGESLISAHVGDCRLFLLRGDTLTQLTKDHTWAREPSRPGNPGRDDGTGRTRRYAIPRCLGHELVLSVDVLTMTVRGCDTFLQSTTGLHMPLTEDELRETLAAHPPPVACQTLVQRARRADGRDDASVQIAVVTPPHE